jgi:nicotinamidase/pyrazinamidase
VAAEAVRLVWPLARDGCVLWTAQDALQAGFRASVLWDLTRPVTPDTNDATRQTLAARGIGCIDSAQLRS